MNYKSAYQREVVVKKIILLEVNIEPWIQLFFLNIRSNRFESILTRIAMTKVVMYATYYEQHYWEIRKPMETNVTIDINY